MVAKEVEQCIDSLKGIANLISGAGRYMKLLYLYMPRLFLVFSQLLHPIGDFLNYSVYIV